MRERFQRLEAHHPRSALEAVRRAENFVETGALRLAFEREQPLVELLNVLVALFAEDLEEVLVFLIAGLHFSPGSRPRCGRGSPPRS
jgi:hypothetical protein